MSSAGTIAKHLLSSWVDSFDEAAASVKGNDAIHDGVQDRLHQAVLSRKACCTAYSSVTFRNTNTAPTTAPLRSRIGAQLSAMAHSLHPAQSTRCGWPAPALCHALRRP